MLGVLLTPDGNTRFGSF